MKRLTLLRQAVVAALKAAAIPTVADRVYPSRSRKVWTDEGDLALVFTQETSSDDEDTAPTIYRNDTSVVVQLIAQETAERETSPGDLEDDEQEEALEARLDDLAEAVVVALQPVHGVEGPFGGLVEWFRFRGTRPTLTAEGELLRNSRQVLFSAQWRAALPDTVPESEFLRMGSDLAPPTSAHAEDLGSETVTNMRTP